MSADERYVAVADGSGCVQILDLADGRLITCVSQPGVHDVRFSHDGRYMSLVSLISKSGTNVVETVKLWSTKDWTAGPEAAVEASVRGVAFSLDNRHLAVGMNAGRQEAICYWEFESKDMCRAVSHPPDVTQFIFDDDFNDIAFRPDGQAWRAASVTGAVSVDLTSGAATRYSSVSDSPVVDPSGTAFVTRPSGGIATLWARNEVVGHLVHPADVRNVRFSPDGQTIVTTCDDGIIRIWDAGLRREQQNDFFRSNRLVGIVTHGSASTRALPNRAELVRGIDISPDGTLLATGGNDGWVRLWRLRAEPGVEVGRHGQWVSGLSAGPTGDTFLSSSDYYGRLWRLNPMREAARLRRHENDAHGVVISEDGRLVATTGEDSQVYLFDGRTGRLLRAIKHDDDESFIESALAGNANYLLTSGSGVIKLWQTATGALVSQIKSGSSAAKMAMSPTESLAAIAQQRRTMLVDVQGQLKVVAEIESASDVTVLRFDRTGARLALGLANGDVRLMDVRHRREIRALHHLGRVTSADFTRDNAFLATGSHDRTVRIWDPVRGSEVSRLTREYGVDAVAFVGDDTLIASGGQNYVQVSPWRSTDLVKLACAALNGLQGDSWPRLVGREIDPSICAAADSTRSGAVSTPASR